MLNSIKMEHFDNVDELKSKCIQIFIWQEFRGFSWEHFFFLLLKVGFPTLEIQAPENLWYYKYFCFDVALAKKMYKLTSRDQDNFIYSLRLAEATVCLKEETFSIKFQS